MDFHVKINIPDSQRKITFSDKLIFLGSCFSDDMSILARQHGFHVLDNPFGTLFHPLAIGQNVLDSLNGNEEVQIIQNDDVYLDFNCSSKVFAMSEAELIEKVILIRSDFKNEIKNANYLYITLGTAFAYHIRETLRLVGNCHKQPSQLFIKSLTGIDEIVSFWSQVIKEIKQLNADIQICFTVSPVRHVKDGLHENNVSKSTLMLAINELQKNDNSLIYFPAFELINDVLRDYRFFKEDLVHPNQQAIKFVWRNFMKTFLSSEISILAEQVNHIKVSEKHRLHFPESKTAMKFIEQIEKQKSFLKEENLNIYWG